MKPVEVVKTESSKVSCDGGKGPLGHPKVYLKISKDNKIDCPYCGKQFVLKK